MDESGREYVSMTHDEATKNQPEGIKETSSVEKEARMCSTSEDQLFDGLDCLKVYLQKLKTWRNDEGNFQTGVSVKHLHQ